MAADYLVASLQPLTLDGPPPYTAERFIELCRSQLSAGDAEAVAAVMGDAASGHTLARRWRDLDSQIRNAVAAERARLHGQDAARWRRPADGCSLYWANRAVAAFQEKDVARRERLLDQVRWDAAGELTPAASRFQPPPRSPTRSGSPLPSAAPPSGRMRATKFSTA